MRPTWYLSCALALASGQVAAQAPAAPRDVVTRAVTAIGGESALRSMRGVAVESYAVTFAIGQEETPESPPRATVSAGRSDRPSSSRSRRRRA